MIEAMIIDTRGTDDDFDDEAETADWKRSSYLERFSKKVPRHPMVAPTRQTKKAKDKRLLLYRPPPSPFPF
jgi:hypothetical protein